MELQKYSADKVGTKFSNGGEPWYARWEGGLRLALIRNCRTPFGPLTVYIIDEVDGDEDSPAACEFMGRPVKGHVVFDSDNGGLEFKPLEDEWVYPRVLAEN
jgi:hypothetical protein